MPCMLTEVGWHELCIYTVEAIPLRTTAYCKFILITQSFQ